MFLVLCTLLLIDAKQIQGNVELMAAVHHVRK